VPWHPQILADVSQPEGSVYAHHINTGTPRIFRPSYGPVTYLLCIPPVRLLKGTVKSLSYELATRHFVRPEFVYMLSALAGQTKCKQTQLAGCKFD
jgi:hypothetical protein